MRTTRRLRRFTTVRSDSPTTTHSAHKMFRALLLASAIATLPFDSRGDVVANLNSFRFRDFVPRYMQTTTTTTTSTREARGFQFHVHNDDLIVHLEFTVPLIEIPVHRSMAFARTALRNLVNLNVGSLLFSAGILAIGGVIFALLRALTTPTFVYASDNYYAGKKESRLHDALHSDQMIRDGLVNELSLKLRAHDIDAATCLQHTICQYFSAPALNASSSTGHWHNVLDGLINLREMQPIVRGSPLQRAIEASSQRGSGSGNCAALPGNCRWLGATNALAQILSKYLT